MTDKNENSKKIRIGWFSFSCCEDSTIVFTEMLNDHWQEWKKIFDFQHARVLQSKNVLDQLDVAFIEGALSSQNQVDKVKEIRAKSAKVVAIGACAVTGMPSVQRNQFDEERQKEIKLILEKFEYLPKAKKLSEVIKVDIDVPGCPMDEKKFMAVLDTVIKEYNIKT